MNRMKKKEVIFPKRIMQNVKISKMIKKKIRRKSIMIGRNKHLAIPIIFLILIILLCSFVLNVAASSYPEKPIKMVVPYNPGGGSDISARIFAKYAEEYFGQPMVVTNIAGAGGAVGGQEVLDSRPDGYTLFWHHQAMHAGYHTGVADYTWDSFTPICMAAGIEGNCIVVLADAPWNKIEEFIDYIEEHPGELRMAVNIGATTHFIGIAIDVATGGDKLVYVSAGGDADRITKLLGGHVDVIPNSINVAKNYIDAGEVKGLAITGRERSSALPDIPTFLEKGYDVLSVIDYGVFGPAGMSEEVVDFISKTFENMCKDERIIRELEEHGTNVSYLDQEAFKQLLLDEDVRYYRGARAAGMIKD